MPDPGGDEIARENRVFSGLVQPSSAFRSRTRGRGCGVLLSVSLGNSREKTIRYEEP